MHGNILLYIALSLFEAVINFGEVPYKSTLLALSASKIISVQNQNLSQATFLDFCGFINKAAGITLKIFEIDDNVELLSSASLNAYYQSNDPVDRICLGPGQRKSILLVVYTSKQPETSMHSISTSLVMNFGIYENNVSNVEGTLSISILATLVTSLLFVDCNEIYFSPCAVGGSYVKKFQIWNRSECILLCRLLSDGNESSATNVIQFIDAESELAMTIGEDIIILPYATKQIQMLLHAETVGSDVRVFRIANLKNPENEAVINCRAEIVAESNATGLQISTCETGGDEAVKSVLNFDGCFFSSQAKKTLLLQNGWSEAMRVCIFTDHSSQMRCTAESSDLCRVQRDHKIAFHIPRLDVLDAGKYSQDVVQMESARSTEDFDEHDDDDKPARLSIDGISLKAVPLTLDFASPRANNSTGSVANEAYNWSNIETTAQRYMHKIVNQLGMPWGNLDFSLQDFNCYSNNMHERSFLSSTAVPADSSNGPSRSSSIDGSDRGDNKSNNNPNSPRLPTTVKAGAGSFDSRFVVEDNNSMSSTSHSILMLEVAPYATASVHLTWNSFCIADGISLVEPGCLLTLRDKLWFEWSSVDHFFKQKVNFGNDVVQVEGNGEPQTRELECILYSCENLFSVNSPILDLGECNVGEFKASFFIISNNCDLEITVNVHVASESLSITGDPIVAIPPRSSRVVNIDYVAREENVNYRRDVFIENEFHRIKVDVRAKNVDKHQVLLHSQLYKIHTYNQKRQLQVFFDTCLANMPNIRVFSIQNLYSQFLRLEIAPIDCNDISILRIEHSDLDWTATSVDSDSISGMVSSTSAPSVPEVVRIVRIMTKSRFPISEIETVMSPGIGYSPENLEKNEAACISSIRDCYRQLRDVLRTNRDLEALIGRDNSSKVIELPPSQSFSFMVVFEPSDPNKFQGYLQQNFKQRDTIVDFLLRQIHIRVLNVTYGDARKHLQQGADVTEISTAADNIAESQAPLKYRLLTIRAKMYKSNFSVLQRSINFGQVLVGKHESTAVAILNSSNSLCVYNIGKSRNFASGFLHISGESSGVILPQTTKQIYFKFKPTLPGAFEEAITVENVLDSSLNQVIVVKAFVSKSEKFEVKVLPSYASHRNDAQSLEYETVKRAVTSYFAETSAPDGSGHIICQENAIVGSNYREKIVLRLKNLSSKKRTFVIDASSLDAVSLINCSDFKDMDSIAEEMKLFDDPSSWSSIITMRCKFEAVWEQEIEPMSDATKSKLEDELEVWQRKARIYTRKKKEKKLITATRHIDRISAILQGDINEDDAIVEDDEEDDADSKVGGKAPPEIPQVGMEQQVDTSFSLLSPDSSELEGGNIAIPVAACSESQIASPEKPDPDMSRKSIVSVSDVTAHVELLSEKSIKLSVEITFLPGLRFRIWNGPLPFRGNFRVFECKNEDTVKCIQFGVTVSAPSKTSCVSPQSTQQSIHPFNSDISNISAAPSSFLVSVASGSTSPTKLVFPSFRQSQTNNNASILAASLKLSRSAKDPRQFGYFSISSLLQSKAKVDLSIVSSCDFGIANRPVVYYNSALHGDMCISTTVPTPDIVDCSSDKWFTGTLETTCSPDIPLHCCVRWNPALTLRDEILMVSALCISFFFEEESDVGVNLCQSQILLPIVCYFDHKSSFNMTKSISCGEISLGGSKIETIFIGNTSTTDNLHYLAVPQTTVQSINSIEFVSGQTGIVPACSKTEIRFKIFGQNIGDLSQDICVTNLLDLFDQKLVNISASIVARKKRPIEFVGLTPDPTNPEEKYLPIDLGLLQIASPGNFNVPTHQSGTWLPGVFANDGAHCIQIINISTEPMAVNVTTNLRSQCNVFVDSTGLVPATDVYLQSNEIKSFYLIVRPQLPNFDRWENSSSRQVDNPGGVAETNTTLSFRREMAKGRELVGGIRFVFNQIVDPAANIGQKRRVFETTISFKALVGMSILKIHPSQPMMHYLRAPIEQLQPSLLRGSFILENKSPTFPVNFKYSSSFSNLVFSPQFSNCSMSEAVVSYAMSFNTKKDQVDVLIISTDCGTLFPSCQCTVEYILVIGPECSGYGSINLEVTNLFTSQAKSIPLLFQIETSSINLQAMMGPRMTSEIPTINCLSPIWIAPCQGKYIAGSVDSPVSTPKPQSKCYEIIGTSRKALNYVTVTNISPTRLCFVPKSNLPIRCHIIADSERILVEGQESIELCTTVGSDYVAANDASPMVRDGNLGRVSSNFASRRFPLGKPIDSPTHSPMPPDSFQMAGFGSKPLSLEGLHNCGDAFWISSKESVTLLITCHVGKILSDDYIQNFSIFCNSQFRQGLSCSLIGFFGLCPWTNPNFGQPSLSGKEKKSRPLSALFGPPVERDVQTASPMLSNLFQDQSNHSDATFPTANSLDRSKTPPFAATFDFVEKGLLPLVGFSHIHCEFAVPCLQVNESNVNLGCQLVGVKKQISLCHISNKSNNPLLVSIENFPNWLCVDHLTYSVDDSSQYITENTLSTTCTAPSGILFWLKECSTAVVTATVCLQSIAKKFSHKLKFANVALQQYCRRHGGHVGLSDIGEYDLGIEVEVELANRIEIGSDIGSPLLPGYYTRLDKNADPASLFETTFLPCNEPTYYLEEDQWNAERQSTLIPMKSTYLELPKHIIVPGRKLDSSDAATSDRTINNLVTVVHSCENLSCKLDYQCQAAFSVRNSGRDDVKINADVKVEGYLASLIEMKLLFKEAGEFAARKFYLTAGESMQLRIAVTGLASGRIVLNSKSPDEMPIAKAIRVVSAADCSNYPDVSGGPSPNMEIWNDGLVGPMLLGTVTLEQRWGSKKKQEAAGVEIFASKISAESNLATATFDVVGYLFAGPTAVITRSPHAETALCGFHLKQLEDAEIQELTTRKSRPHLELENNQLTLQAWNLSVSSFQQLRFVSMPTCYRGLRLHFPNPTNSHLSKDSIFTDTVAAVPEVGEFVLPPNTGKEITMHMAPSTIFDFSNTNSWKCSQITNSSGSETLTTACNPLFNDAAIDICSLQVLVHDDNFPLHQSGSLDLILQSSTSLPLIKATPVTTSSYHQKHVGALKSAASSPRGSRESLLTSNLTSSAGPLCNVAAPEFSKYPKLNIRGCAQYSPASSPDIELPAQFEINLGQQMKREEFIEWIVTMENCSAEVAMEYLIHLSPSSAEEWLVPNHSGGIIPAASSSNLMLYVSRQCAGTFSGVIAIDNISNLQQSRQCIAVKIELQNPTIYRDLAA